MSTLGRDQDRDDIRRQGSETALGLLNKIIAAFPVGSLRTKMSEVIKVFEEEIVCQIEEDPSNLDKVREISTGWAADRCREINYNNTREERQEKTSGRTEAEKAKAQAEERAMYEKALKIAKPRVLRIALRTMLLPSGIVLDDAGAEELLEAGKGFEAIAAILPEGGKVKDLTDEQLNNAYQNGQPSEA